MKTIISDLPSVHTLAAQEIAALVAEKPDAVLAFAVGRTMKPLFAELARLCGEGGLSLSQAGLFAVTEFEDAPEELSCRRALESGLLAVTDLRPENCRFLTREKLESYDDEIAAAGGLDLAVLGLGVDAHIGFNEPATPYASRTHRQKLTGRTRRQYAALFGSEEAVPAYGYTMGILTLVEAKHILVLATGEEKARAAFQMLYARDDSYIPAAFLQLPLNVTVFLDSKAARDV